jgi:hypothetical protein
MKKMIIIVAALMISAATQAQKVASDKVPAVVMKAFNAKFPKAEGKWEMEDKTQYEANFKFNGKEMSANFDATGNWTETEIEMSVSQLPEAVQQTLTKQFSDYKIKESSQVEQPGKAKFYEMDVVKGKEKSELKIAASGDVIEKKVETEKD